MAPSTSSQFDKFDRQLSELLHRGTRLQAALGVELGTSTDESLAATKTEQDALPDFGIDYESWYSEALRVIATVLPEREQDFRSQYKAKSSYALLDYLTNPEDPFDHDALLMSRLKNQRAILKAAGQILRSHLADIRGVLQADLFDSELDAATSLWKGGFYRGAGAMAGVVLESHLLSVCVHHSLPVGKRHSISTLNEKLKKAGVIDTPKWRQITLLGDLRNKCDHKFQLDPTREDVNELIIGVSKIIKTVF